jgi:hypothetical protein
MVSKRSASKSRPTRSRSARSRTAKPKSSKLKRVAQAVAIAAAVGLTARAVSRAVKARRARTGTRR